MTYPSEAVPAVLKIESYNRTILACLMLATKRKAEDLAIDAMSEGLAQMMRQAAEQEGMTVGEWFRRRSNQLGHWRAGRDVPIV